MTYFGSLVETGAGDPDFDGATNAEELAAGTDPTVGAAFTIVVGEDSDSICGLLGIEVLALISILSWRRRRTHAQRIGIL